MLEGKKVNYECLEVRMVHAYMVLIHACNWDYFISSELMWLQSTGEYFCVKRLLDLFNLQKTVKYIYIYDTYYTWCPFYLNERTIYYIESAS